MKKFIYLFIAFFGMLFAVSCGQADDPVPPSPEPMSNVDLLYKDTARILAQYPDMHGRFIEVRYYMNDNFDKKDADELKIDSVLYYFSKLYTGEHKDDIVTGHRDLKDNTPLWVSKHSYKSPWVGDQLMGKLEGLITLADAIDIVKNSDCPQPFSGVVVFGKPVTPQTYGRVCYSFGPTRDGDYTITVDANTGELLIYEVGDEE